jgi:hypothetical protein
MTKQTESAVREIIHGNGCDPQPAQIPLAIALDDVGHDPYNHTGERACSSTAKAINKSSANHS